MAFEDARSLAHGIANIASDSLGAPLWLRDYPARGEGDVGFVAIGVEHAGYWRAIGVVKDLEVTLASVLVGEVGGVATVVGVRGEGEEAVARQARHLSELMLSGWLDRFPLGALDAGLAVLDTLTQGLAVAGSWWRFTTFGESGPSGGSGTLVELGGEHEWSRLVWATQAPEGVIISTPPAAFGQTRCEQVVGTPRSLLAALPGLVSSLRCVIDARAAFRQRPFPVGVAGERLLRAIEAAGSMPGRLDMKVADGAGFPAGYPSAILWRFDALGQHRTVSMDESEAGIHVSAGRGSWHVRSSAELDAILAAVVDAVHDDFVRLTPDKLEQEARYRCKRALGDLPENTVLRFTRCRFTDQFPSLAEVA